MVAQKQFRTTEGIEIKLPKGKATYSNGTALFSLESSLTKDEAIKLYKNFDTFIADSTSRIEHAEKSDVLNIIIEIIHYFNVALKLLPSLSSKSGDFLKFIELGVGVCGGGGGGGWQSYTLQFGFPIGVSLALHFNS